MTEINTWLLQFVLDIGLFGAIIICIFHWFGKQWIAKWIEQVFSSQLEENKNAHQRELEKLRHDINIEFNRFTTLYKKECEVLPEAWVKLHDAKDAVTALVSQMKQTPDIKSMGEAEIKDLLEGRGFSEMDIKSLLSNDDKENKLRDLFFYEELYKAKNAFAEYHRFIARNSIFIKTELKEKFLQLDKLLWESVIDKEVGYGANDFKIMHKAYKALRDNLDSILKDLEEMVQNRLHYK